MDKLNKSKAEVNRQVADYLAVLDLPERRTQTADFALRAYELDPTYHVLYNIGQASFQLRAYADARRAFEQAVPIRAARAARAGARRRGGAAHARAMGWRGARASRRRWRCNRRSARASSP